MGLRIAVTPDRVTVTLSGWDRLFCWRRSVEVASTDVRAASLQNRQSLEQLIDHRVSGVGSHDGAKRPGRHRVGTMLGRDVDGKQFWAVPAAQPSDRLLVLDLSAGEFARLVAAVEDPDGAEATIRRGLGPDAADVNS